MRCHSVSSFFSPSRPLKVSVVATLNLATGVPVPVKRSSASLPRLPTRITRFTVPIESSFLLSRSRHRRRRAATPAASRLFGPGLLAARVLADHLVEALPRESPRVGVREGLDDVLPALAGAIGLAERVLRHPALPVHVGNPLAGWIVGDPAVERGRRLAEHALLVVAL